MSSSERKAEFRRYLESSGVMDAIVQSLVQLYHLEEKPENPLEFVKQHLGGSSGGASGGSCEEKDATIEHLNKEIEELKHKLGEPTEEAKPVEEEPHKEEVVTDMAHEAVTDAEHEVAPPDATHEAAPDAEPEAASEAEPEAPAEEHPPTEEEQPKPEE